MAKVYIVQDNWFSRKDANEDVVSLWCDKVDAANVRCNWCKSTFKVTSKAFGAVRQHSEMQKHRFASKTNRQALKISPSVNASSGSQSTTALGLYVQDHAAMGKEILWAIHLTMKNSSDAGVDKDQGTLQLIAPNDMKNFTLGRTKLAYIKTPIAAWFSEKVFKDISKTHYTLMFDDTTNNQHTKELQLVVKYWSKSLKRLNFVHLKSAFMESGRALPAVDVILKAIKTHQLDIGMLLQIGSDGPNVTKTVKAKMNAVMIEDRGFELLDIGSCHDHILHNSLKEGCKIMKNVHHLCQQISDFFKTSSKWAEFSAKYNLHLKFVTFFSIRWTTLGPATARILKYWKEIVEYFSDIERNKAEKDKLVSEKTIIKLLSSGTIRSEIAFVHQVADIVEPVLTFLERKDQVIFQADEVYFKMLCKLAAFIAIPASDTFNNIVTSKTVPADQHFSVQLSSDVTENMDPSALPAFEKSAGTFISAMIRYLVKHNFFHQFLYCAKFMTPSEIFNKGSTQKIMQLSRFFKSDVIKEKKLYDELTILVTKGKAADHNEHEDIDQFYCKLMEEDYPNLTTLFTMVSACSVSNAEVERYFSRSGLIITKKVSNLDESSFNDRKHIISGMQFYNNDLKLLKMDANLFSRVNQAHSTYKRKLEEQKQLASESLKRQRTEEDDLQHLELIAAINEGKELSRNVTNEISSIGDDLANERDKAKSILDAIFEKTTDSSEAPDKVDTIRKLSLNLAGTNSKIKELEEKLNAIQSNLIKKQSSVIEKFNQNNK